MPRLIRIVEVSPRDGLQNESFRSWTHRNLSGGHGEFSQRNLNASMGDCFAGYAEVVRAPVGHGIRVRGYVPVAFHCPFEGWVDPSAALNLTTRLFDAGCYEVSICDTTGRATPGHLCAG